MQSVPIELVNLTIKTFDNYSEKKIGKMLQNFDKQQPEINHYIRGLVEAYKWNTLETSTYLMIITMAYVMLRRSENVDKLPLVTQSQLLSKQFDNERIIDTTQDVHESGDALLEMIEAHNQSHVLAFIVTALQTAYLENEMIEEKNLLPAIVHLKSVLDCLDA